MSCLMRFEKGSNTNRRPPSSSFEAGLEVTALHNHIFFDEPKVYFMHIGGMGEAGAISAGVKKVHDKIAEIRGR